MDRNLEARVKRCFERNPGWDIRRRANGLKVRYAVIQEYMKKHGIPEQYELRGEDGPQKPKKRKIGISMQDFMEEHDPVTKMRATLRDAVALLSRNKGRFVKNHELRKESGCGDSALWKDIAQDPDEGFTKYQFSWHGEIWWSDEDTVAQIIKTKKQARPINGDHK